MIFLGDIASPTESTSASLEKIFKESHSIFTGKKLVCNFEGLIFNGILPELNEPVLYNHPSVLKSFNQFENPIFCLANNHILDLPGQFDATIGQLKGEGISFVGAGKNKKEAEDPILFNEGGCKVILLNACWDFLLYNHKNPRMDVYVSELNEIGLLRKIEEQKAKFPEALIVVFLHWSLDLETLPFPMYRQYSRAMINSGASIVVGTHSHCVQGGEKYNNGYIVYGLGNFFVPQNVFINGRLIFPEFANHQLALEWDPATNKTKCHWFEYKYDGINHNLLHIGHDDFIESERLKQYSPFLGMSENDYLVYFKEHRRKKIFIPIYENHKKIITNRIYTFLLKSRAHISRLLARMEIIKWQN